MQLPRFLSKEVLLRIEGVEAIVSTVRYGCFYSKTKAFNVASAPRLQPSALRAARYLVPLLTTGSAKRTVWDRAA